MTPERMIRTAEVLAYEAGNLQAYLWHCQPPEPYYISTPFIGYRQRCFDEMLALAVELREHATSINS